jgi:hypothetical protein
MIQTLSKKLMLCALVGSLTLAQPLVAQPDKAASQPTVAAEKKAKRKTYKGTIDMIDPAGRTVTVKKATTSKTFKIAGDAKFATSNNQNASLAPLQPGDVVNVRFTDEGDVATAHHIARAGKRASAARKSE